LSKSVDTINCIKRSDQRNTDELNTSRIIIPSLNNSFDCDFGRGRKNNYPEVKKSVAVGSIHNFISLIPVSEVKFKKYYENNAHITHTKIFSTDFNFSNNHNKRLKVAVNLKKIQNDKAIAGISSTHKQNSVPNSYRINAQNFNIRKKTEAEKLSSRKVDYKVNMSTIFGTTSTECSVKNTARKTYYNMGEYKKFFNNNFQH